MEKTRDNEQLDINAYALFMNLNDKFMQSFEQLRRLITKANVAKEDCLR